MLDYFTNCRVQSWRTVGCPVFPNCWDIRVFAQSDNSEMDPRVRKFMACQIEPLKFFFADLFFSCGVRFFFPTLFLYTSCNENHFKPNFGPLIVDFFSVSRFVVANYPFCIVHSCSGAHHCCNRFLTFNSRT
jgi:hypothetical protein